MEAAARTPRFGIASAAALLAGICACLSLPWRVPWPCVLLVLVAGVGLWGWNFSGKVRPRRLAGATLLGFGLAGLHATWALSLQLPVSWQKRDAIVSGTIVDLPVHEVRRTRFLFRVEGDARQPAALRGRLLRLAWYDDDPARRSVLKAGARWQLPIRVGTPRGLRNPGAPDAEKHAMGQRIAAVGYVRKTAFARPLSPPTGIPAWREAMSARIESSVSSPSSRFIRALALGDTRALDDTDWNALRATGLTHLVAISGFHVGLVAGFFALAVRGLWWLWPTLGRRWPRPVAASLMAMLGAAGYAGLAGMSLPTVRTVLMIAVVAALAWSRRPRRAMDTLAMVAMIVLLADPLAVLGAGFWLSFLGVAWLVWCLSGGAGRPWREAWKEFLAAQGVATLGLLPLGVVLFGQASLAGPVANLVAVPWWSLVVVPLSLLGTGIEAVFAGAGGWAWKAAAWCFDPSWRLFEGMAASPLALVWLPEPAWLALPLALLGAFWLLLPRGVPGKPLALLLWLPLLWPERGLPARGAVELLVIDVGQGLSVLVRTADHALLYDMGPAVRDGFDAGERAVVPALHAMGVARLDHAVVSHGDNDHAGGLDAVRAAIPVAHLDAPAGSGVQRASPCRAGQAWTWDGVGFRYLHPDEHFPYLGNEASCVLRIESRYGAVLLTGDVGEVIERRLLHAEPAALRADVILVAHHGSGGSSDAGFVAASHARHAVVSSGFGNRFGHPRPEVLSRWRGAGAEVHDTAHDGALRIRIQEGGVRVEARRRTHPRLWDATRR